MGKIWRKFIGRKVLHVHFDQTDKRAAKVRPFSATAIDDHADAGNLTPVGADDVDGFLHAAAASDDIFRHDELLARRDLKPAAQHQAARFFLNEDVSLAERAADLLTDDDSAESRGNHGVALKVAQLVSETPADFRRDGGMLKQDGALKKLATVEAGTQNKMAIKQGAGLAEERKQVFAH